MQFYIQILSGTHYRESMYRKMSPKTVSILFVNDDLEDRCLISEAFNNDKDKIQLYKTVNSGDLLSYLKGKNKYTDRDNFPLPSLILLDLGESWIYNRDVLADIKKDPELRRIPIIVLTKSQDEDNFQENDDLGITGFIKKPMTIDGLVDVMKTLDNYLFQAMILPTRY